MAKLEQAGEFLTGQLRERVDELLSAVQDKTWEFAEISRLADAVGEVADTIGQTYSDLDQTLMRFLQGNDSGEREQHRARQQPKQQRTQQPRRAQRQQHPQQNGSKLEELTKEELLERAREVDVPGRSSMSKDELAQAVEAEESVSKEELLERAREAGIEGRSSMTKDELRDALRGTGG